MTRTREENARDAAIDEPKHMVITGNPVDGLFFYGPFDDRDEAVIWAEAEQEGMDWWIGELVNPAAVAAAAAELDT